MMITRLRKQIHAAEADLTPAFLRSLRGLQTPGANSPKLDILLYSTFWVARKSGCPGANYLQDRLRSAESYLACSLWRERPQLPLFFGQDGCGSTRTELLFV